MILFDGRGADPIWRVPATGGIAKPEVAGVGGQGAGWPVFLPDGKRFLYMDIDPAGQQTLKVGTLDQKDAKELFKTVSRVLYAEPGYLIFVREQTLVAQKVDPATLAIAGRTAAAGRGARHRLGRPRVVRRVARRACSSTAPASSSGGACSGTTGPARSRRPSTCPAITATSRSRPTERGWPST